jgi:hypothetical protein
MPSLNCKDETRPNSSHPSVQEKATNKTKKSPQEETVVSSDETSYKEVADRIRSRMKHAVQNIVEIGRDLIVVKEGLGHGNFLSWIDHEFKMSEKSAERFMAVAGRYGDKIDSVSNLSLTALYELAAPSTPDEVRAEVANRVAGGVLVTAAEVKELKSKIKERDDELRVQKTASEIERNVATRHLQERDAKIQDLGQQLARLRVELRHTQPGGNIDYEPMKAALVAVWTLTPKEIKDWFLEVVGHSPKIELNSAALQAPAETRGHEAS